jgi:hypothetical protein
MLAGHQVISERLRGVEVYGQRCLLASFPVCKVVGEGDSVRNQG